MLAPSTIYSDTVAAFDSAGVTSGQSNSARATTAVGPPRACITPAVPSGAVELSSGDDIQTAINRNPSGTTFYLNAGTYRVLTDLIAKNNDTFMGAYGAVLNGSVLLSSFSPAGRYYEVRGVPIQSANDTRTGECNPGSSFVRRGARSLY
jgi:hypothetical protein